MRGLARPRQVTHKSDGHFVASRLVSRSSTMPLDSSIKTVLLIGSGPIVIGQACEFDYSGTQAARALRDEGISVVLVNSNPATIMTDPLTAEHIYLRPLVKATIADILKEHPEIDAVLPTMGGQTALNLCMECEKAGLWKKHNVRVIGANFQAIEVAEDREKFRQLMVDIGLDVPKSGIARSFLEGKEAAQLVGFPLVIRASYTLGGTGGGFVDKKEDFDNALNYGLHASPVHEVLIEESIYGWKEYELEVMRDADGNFIVVCSVENFDPVGIHTGDSVTVAPALTLSDVHYQAMRDQAIQILGALIRVGGNFAGGCNVQFALEPKTGRIVVIEINPRVSRSSALASKATGYPIAKIAAKLAVGYRLHELSNQIVKTTSAFFEPSLDYVIVKIPRWNFDKFPGADRRLGLGMKSVGEVMGIGRSFTEALQKACQSLEIKRNGLGADGKESRNLEQLMQEISVPSWNRIFRIHDALMLGVPTRSIEKATYIDKWYLHQMKRITVLEHELAEYDLNDIPTPLLREAKTHGFADRQIAHLLGCLESEVHAKRVELGIERVYKMVDTCAAEFDAATPYFYSTFDGKNESERSSRRKVVILGSGPNRIGQGIEFDYSCVHAVLASKEADYETIMINCNPETVSTDFDIADKLYFEPVFWEHVYDIIRHEKPDGVMVQLGGQTALKLAEKLDKYGINLFGTSFDSIDLAEDRGRFSTLLRDLGIPYPPFGVATDADEAVEVANKIGYPVLVRPSYVLGGQRMRIVINDEDLQSHVIGTLADLPGNQVLIDHFLDRAVEAEVDAVCDGTDVRIIGLMEHIEPAGIHSGDSTAVLPAFTLSDNVQQLIRDYTIKIARALKVVGLINVQFAVKDEQVYVIEANPRASRSVPFICKAYGKPYVNYATKIMLGEAKCADFDWTGKLEGYAIKIPVFSFHKFPNVNKELGPEMKSTGEEIRFISDTDDEFFQKLYSERNLYLSR